MYIPLLLYGGKIAQQLSYGFNIHEVLLGLSSRNLKYLWGYGFLKRGFKSNRFQLVVWSQNLRFFSKDFQPNLEVFAKIEILIPAG